ncbi:MAG TPA: hypothetical protein VF548_11095 [Allosphingosinicella sp.]|jgi:hypothetical protein
MIRPLLAATLLSSLWAGSVEASELRGPARFCGYSPIIDLLEGERVVVLKGGIHAGSFRWEGAFGSLKVAGIGWASRPAGKMLRRPTSRGHALFEQSFRDGGFSVAIWNRRQGAAYFSSSAPITRDQLAAIDRVDLFQEGEEPGDCRLRTIFSWD